MQQTVCSRCAKNRAIVFINRLIDGKNASEGLCLKCAKELNTPGVDNLIANLGLDAQNIDEITKNANAMLDNLPDPQPTIHLKTVQKVSAPQSAGKRSSDIQYSSALPYNELRNGIRQFAVQFADLEKNLAALDSKQDQKIVSAIADIECELSKLNNIIPSINAHINIAKAHSHRLTASKEQRAPDLAQLSRLALKIDISKSEDPIAVQLYTEATGMLLSVNTELARLRNEKNTVRNRFDQLKREQQELLRTQQAVVLDSFILYLNSDAFIKAQVLLKNAHSVLLSEETILPEMYAQCGFSGGFLPLGMISRKVAVPRGGSQPLAKRLPGIYIPETSSFREIYCSKILQTGGVVLWEDPMDTDLSVISGLARIVTIVGLYYSEQIRRVIYIDPVRMNGSALGKIEPLTQGSRPFIQVPKSGSDIEKVLRQELDRLNPMNTDSDTLYIFCSYPEEYSSDSSKMITQLCMNAGYFHVPVLVTHQYASNMRGESRAYQLLQAALDTYFSYAETSNTQNGRLVLFSNSRQYQYFPFSAPEKLSAALQNRCMDRIEEHNVSTKYPELVGLQDSFTTNKGRRYISNIPIGVDDMGNQVLLDFENSNFATFICGAARSGKSTLLHTIITGLIQRNHPDDIEIWLIDFKLVEFSRYINHLPPHIRYILLDESPELAYDIIDRLTDILHRRESIFQGKWQKLSQVPPNQYMPALFVIIDEFSIMSEIIKDSENYSGGNYVAKFQNLLTKGAGLGMHFIFSSQGFTQGTKCLTPLAKQQIQQRIAMKTEYSEVQETLDLKNVSDEDKQLMYQLAPHHALVRHPMDEKGRQLKYMEVLYFPDYQVQEEWIERISLKVTPTPRFQPDDESSYISKQPLLVDGSVYLAFSQRESDIRNRIMSYIQQHGVGTLLFPGEPKRMSLTWPVEITDSFCQNLILIAPLKENDPAVSLLVSCMKSVQMQGHETVCISSNENTMNKVLRQYFDDLNRYVKGLDDVCAEIRSLREKIESNQPGDGFYFLLGFGRLLMDMSFASQLNKPTSGEQTSHVIQRAESETPSLFTKMGIDPDTLFPQGSESATIATASSALSAAPVKNSVQNTFSNENVYDARDDLKYILTYGPPLGYHFFMAFTTVEEYNRIHIPTDLFQHRFLFQTARSSTFDLVGSREASFFDSLPEHSFRYTDGLNATSFRPFLHKGLEWSWWKLDDNGVVSNSKPEEEDYLM